MKPSSCLALLFVLACGGASTTPSTTPRESVNEPAYAELERAQERYDAMSQLHIDCGGRANLEEFVACIQEEVRALSNTSEETLQAFRRVSEHSDEPRWTVASLAGQGRTYALMARTVNGMEMHKVYPAALLEEDVRMSEEARQMIDEQVEANIRAVIEPMTAPIVCLSAVRDVLALRLAQAHQIDSEYSQESAGRLSEMSEEQISACVDEGQTMDDTLEPYAPGELNLQR